MCKEWNGAAWVLWVLWGLIIAALILFIFTAKLDVKEQAAVMILGLAFWLAPIPLSSLGDS